MLLTSEFRAQILFLFLHLVTIFYHCLCLDRVLFTLYLTQDDLSMVETKKNPRSAFNYHSDDEESMVGHLKSNKKGVSLFNTKGKSL